MGVNYIPQAPLMPVAPSPLAGLGEAAQTIADAVIRRRERQALSQDQTLIGTALAQIYQPQAPQTESVQEGGMDFSRRVDPEPVSPLAVWQSTLGQMKTPQGKAAAIRMMMEHAPQPLYGYDEAGNLVQRGSIPKNAEIMKAPPADKTTTVYDSKTGKSFQVQGGFAQLKSEPTTTVITPQGPQEVTGRVIFDPAYKEGTKRFKPELFEGPGGQRKWIAPGEEVPANFQQSGKADKNDPTGYTREGISWMNTVGLDSTKKDSWDVFNSYRNKAKDKDVAMWALQQATAAVSKTDEYQFMKDPTARSKMIMDEANNFINNRQKLQKPAGQNNLGSDGKWESLKKRFQRLQKTNPNAAKELGDRFPRLIQ